jgi:DNA-binding transcriptional LysR family regulator
MAWISDLERVRSQVADLSGVRRGHVSIACSQALLPYFLPSQIARYRQDHPGVTFSVNVRDRAAAERDLSSFSSDLALVFEPVHMVEFEVLLSVPQPIHVVMSKTHPLADKEEIRLRDCLETPHILPTPQLGVRHLLEIAARESSRQLKPILEADSFEFMRQYVRHEGVVGFQIPIGLEGSGESDLVFKEVARQDVPTGHLLLGQMKGRALPVASARFANQLAIYLGEREAIAGVAS